MPKVLLISGSTARPSHTLTLTRLAELMLLDQGMETVLWDLRARPLPPVLAEYHHGRVDHPDPVVREIRQLAQEADAFVLASPVYHNSYSGVLKNCLDHLDIAQFRLKPVGILAHGGRHRSTQPADHLRIVVRGLHGVAVPQQVVTADDDYVVGSDGQYRIRNREIVSRVRDLCAQLLTFMSVREREYSV